MPNMKDLSLRAKKLWPMLKFFEGQTDRQKDGQSGALIIPNRFKIICKDYWQRGTCKETTRNAINVFEDILYYTLSFSLF